MYFGLVFSLYDYDAMHSGHGGKGAKRLNIFLEISYYLRRISLNNSAVPCFLAMTFYDLD